MKKIFTLLFFTGLLSAAVAQDNRHGQYANHAGNNNGYQAPVYNSGSQKTNDNVGYNANMRTESNNQNNENGYREQYTNRDKAYTDNRGRDGRDYRDENFHDNYRRRVEFNRYENYSRNDCYTPYYNRRGRW